MSLKKKVLNSLDALLKSPARLRNEAITAVKNIISEHPSIIPPDYAPALVDFILTDVKNIHKNLKNKEINNKQHKEILAFVFLLYATHPVFTRLTNRTEESRTLAQECVKEITLQNKPRQHPAKRK